MVPFLEREHQKLPPTSVPARCARVQIVVRSEDGKNQLYELLVDLDQSKIIKQEPMEGKHSHIDAEYMKKVEVACMADKRVQSEIHTLALPPGATVVVEPWTYATDGMNDMSERVTMVCTRL